MGCFSSKPAVPRQPVTEAVTETPAPPIPTPQQLPKTQTIPEPKPTPTQILKTRPIPACRNACTSNPSVPNPSPPNQRSAANERTTIHDLHIADETNSAPHTPTAHQVLAKPLNHDTHVTSAPATPVPPIPAINATDQLDQQNPLLNIEQQPSSPHHAATEASVKPHHVKSAIITTSTVAPQPKVDDSTTNTHEESNTPPQSILATTSLIPEESSQLHSTNLENLTAANTESLTTPTLASRECDEAVPASDQVSAQPLPVRLEETEPDLVQNANSVVALQEKTPTQDNALVPETDLPIEQYSASEESEASLHLESIDEANLEPHVEPRIDPHSPVAPDLTTQPPQDSIYVQSNLVNTAPLIPGNNTESQEDLTDTSESDHQIPLGTSEEDPITEEHNATAPIENVVPKHLTPALVTDGSLTRQPKGHGSVTTTFQQSHVQPSAEGLDAPAEPSSADAQPLPLASENTDSILEESPQPAVNGHDIFKSTKSEQYSSSSTFPQQNELDVTSDTQVKHASKEAAQVVPIPVDIQSHMSSSVELEETQRDSAQNSASIVATKKTSHMDDQDLIPVANRSTEQDSTPEQLPTPHNSSAQDLPTPPLQDSMHVQSSSANTSHLSPASPAVSDPNLGNTDGPSQQNYPIVSKDEGMVGQSDSGSKSTYVVPDDLKPAVDDDVALESKPEDESSTGTFHHQPAVSLSGEEVVAPPHSSTARTAGTSVESENTLSTPEESSHPAEAHLDGVTTASTEQSSNTEKSDSIVPPALDLNSSSSETSPLFGETATHTLPLVSSDGTLSHVKDTSFSHIAEEEGKGTVQTKTFDEHDGSHGTRTPSTNEEDKGSSTSTNSIDYHGPSTPSINDEDMKSSASMNGIDSPGSRTPSTFEDTDYSYMESPPSPSYTDSASARTSSRFMDNMEGSQATSKSTWDYRSAYRGGCDRWVMNNPPHDVGYYSFKNYNGNIGTNLPRGAYHYQNIGTDGGFYIKNSDGSSYHYSPYRGGTYKEPYY